MTIDFELVFPDSHPALSGHFPGRPLVPGALLLSRLADRLVQILGRRIRGVSKVRFTQPILPDQRISVTCESRGTHQLRFRCEVAEPGDGGEHTNQRQDALVARGLVTFAEALPTRAPE